MIDGVGDEFVCLLLRKAGLDFVDDAFASARLDVAAGTGAFRTCVTPGERSSQKTSRAAAKPRTPAPTTTSAPSTVGSAVRSLDDLVRLGTCVSTQVRADS